MGKIYKIAEIFESIQGEGSFAGVRASFLRFADCNLNCPFCDTNHNKTMRASAEKIMSLIPNQTRILIVTGGEPLLQIDNDLLQKLKSKYEVHLETNGSLKLNGLDFDHVVVSPKLSRDKTIIERCDDLKLLYPIYNPDEWVHYDCKNKFLQPLEKDGKMYTREAIKYVLSSIDWRLCVQLHKIVGVK